MGLICIADLGGLLGGRKGYMFHPIFRGTSKGGKTRLELTLPYNILILLYRLKIHNHHTLFILLMITKKMVNDNG